MTKSLPPALCPALTEFTDQHHEAPLQPGHQEIAPGIFLNSDPKLGLSGSFQAPAGRLLDLDAQMTGPGDWAGLHIVLPLPDLTDLTYVGFVCRAASPAPLMLRACLRSGLPEQGFVDSFFDKHILTSEQPHSHLDLLFLDAHPELPLTAPWRELVLFLPCQPFTLSLVHLHPFAL